MLSSVLDSDQAADVNVAIMRAFVHLQDWITEHGDLAKKVPELERRYDGQFAEVFTALRQLLAPPPDPPRKPIGFHT